MEGPPNQLQTPETLKSHDMETMDNICKTTFSESHHKKWDQRPSLYKADYLAKSLGTKMPETLSDVKDDLGLMTIKGRQNTFPEEWEGWPASEMARFGLYLTPTDKVKCFACGVSFRKLTSKSICHVKRHKEIAPNCVQLRRYGCGGIRTTPEGKRQRHNSMSALDDMETCDIETTLMRGN